MNRMWKRVLSTTAGLTIALIPAAVASGQQLDEYGDVAASPAGQTVARIGFVEGNVSYARGDDPENWQAADLNVPMTIGDRLYTDDRSRVELQVQGGDVVRLGAKTDLAALNLTEDTRQFAVKAGHATFEIRRLDEDEAWEVDTPNAAVTLEQAGRYRVEVDRDGNTRVSVRRGAASVAAGGGQVALNAGEAIRIDGIDSPRYDVEAVGAPDGWERWNEERENRLVHTRSSQYVHQDLVGLDDLDQYGQWQHVPDYGWCWSPASVEVGWTPYRVGHWVWQDPWGWTWISTEPWGWTPYHYGRWVTYSSRWFWVPVGPSVQVAAYSPALVAFVGGGPGFSVSVGVGGGGGFVGWFPLGPREPLIPWWSRSSDAVNVTNVTYINKTYVTVVNQNTFVSGAVVTNNVVRDRAVIQQVSSAAVVRGALPVVPTAASTRVSVRTAPAARPQAAVVSRAVVARMAPPPAPPRFEQKLAVIRQNGGRPVAPAAAAQLAVQQGGQPRTVIQVRPVASEPGRVNLVQGRQAAGATAAPRVQPVAPAKGGRPMATAQRPVAAAPVVGPRSAGAQRPGQPVTQQQHPEARPSNEPPTGAPIRPTPLEEPGRLRPQENRPPAERAIVPTPNVFRERGQPTPAIRPERAPENRPPAERERPLTPAWRERLQPTPVRPEREAAPENRPRSERERFLTPPAWRERPAATPPSRPEREAAPESRERLRPTAARPVEPPPERVRPQGAPPPPPERASPEDRARERERAKRPTPKRTPPPDAERPPG